MRYEFTNPQDLPNAKDMSTDKEYSTRIDDVKVDNGEIVIRLEYLGEEFPRGSKKCLLPLIKH